MHTVCLPRQKVSLSLRQFAQTALLSAAPSATLQTYAMLIVFPSSIMWILTGFVSVNILVVIYYSL